MKSAKFWTTAALTAAIVAPTVTPVEARGTAN